MVSRLQNFYLRGLRAGHLTQFRTFSRFGHKREPEPLFTVLWHGFLTFSFIGLGINWTLLKELIFGDQEPEIKLKENYTVTTAPKQG